MKSKDLELNRISVMCNLAIQLRGNAENTGLNPVEEYAKGRINLVPKT
jgi:hypothetical protein